MRRYAEKVATWVVNGQGYPIGRATRARISSLHSGREAGLKLFCQTCPHSIV